MQYRDKAKAEETRVAAIMNDAVDDVATTVQDGIRSSWEAGFLAGFLQAIIFLRENENLGTEASIGSLVLRSNVWPDHARVEMVKVWAIIQRARDDDAERSHVIVHHLRDDDYDQLAAQEAIDVVRRSRETER